MSKFISRKLIATSLAIAVVVAADLLGAPMDASTLDAITNMLLGLVGAQGLVDTAGAWRAGQAVIGTVEAAKDLAVVDEPTD
tara:strand:- start:100 stop:345 length:246 start_codon:yes stop_codon:yes gene_type:complete